MNRPRRRTLLACLAAAALTVPTLLATAQENPAGGAMTVYVGTYTGAKSKGIYRMTFDPATGALSKPELAAEAKSPSFLAIHPNNRVLYAIAEVNDVNGKKGGGVSAFAIDAGTGNLTPLNQQTSGGAGPCFVATDPAGKVALVANYGGGSVQSLPIKEDGSLGEPASFVQHTGKGPTPRQKGPNAHSILPSPDGRFALAADLGLDKVLIYRVDPATAKLTPNEPPHAATPAGGGPRHLAFHPSGKYVYVNNEMGMSVTAFKYDAEKGTLTEIGTEGTIPGGEKSPRFSTAEILAHPSGKFVYVSNRGHDSITVYAVDEATGAIKLASNTPTGGKTPRNFRLDPTGQWLLSANQGSDNVVAFKIDPATGALTPTGATAEVGAPVCIKFLAQK
jgi:6-phosphogluconolactonase